MIGKLEVVPDESSLARAAAEHFVAAASAAIRERGKFNVTLAGGSTPKATYAVLRESPLREQVEWEKIRFYFGDERCVPPDHPDSNYGLAHEHLFEPLGLIEEHVYRMRGEIAPEDAAGEYDDLLKKMLGGNPVFDLIMLGMGPEGHTASLFPGTFGQIDPDWFVASTWIEKLHTHRITLAPKTINAARAILVVIGGENKADALAHVLAGPREPDVYPAQILHPEHGTLTWLVDRAAAKGLAE